MPTVIIGDNSGGGTVGTIVQTGLRQQTPTGNFEGSTSLYVDADAVGLIDRVLINPDLSSITGPVTVSSAVLTFLQLGTGARGVEVRRLLNPFTATQATWNIRATGTPWAAAGVLGGADVDATVIATGTTPVGTNGFYTVSGAAFTQLVQDWINGVVPKNGLVYSVVNDTTVFDAVERRIPNRYYATAAWRTTLTIEYTTGTPVNWTISSPTVNSDAGTVTLVVTLDAPAPVGGFSGLVNTYDITAVAGVDYTAQVDVPFSISAGNTTGNIVIPILP